MGRCLATSVVLSVVRFGICAAAFASSHRIFTAVLLIVLGYKLWNMVWARVILFARGTWQPTMGG